MTMAQEFEYQDTLDAAKAIATQAVEEAVDVDKYLLDYTKPVARPNAVISDPTNPNRIIVSEQNILTIVGEAKSYKTYSAKLLAIDYFRQHPNEELLWVDTEQADWNVINSAKTICDGLGWSLTDAFGSGKLRVANLRKYAVDEREQAIEGLISKYHPKLVVIDGARDLVNSINDDMECSTLVNLFMKWTEVYNCAIATVLHTNKDGETARGHLGAELLNKSETILMCKAKDGGGARVKSLRARNQSIDAFDFSIGDDYVPRRDANASSSEELQFSSQKETEALRSLKPKANRPKVEWLTDIRVAAMCSEPSAKKYFDDFVQFGVLVSANREATFFSHYKAVGDTMQPKVDNNTQQVLNIAQSACNDVTSNSMNDSPADPF